MSQSTESKPAYVLPDWLVDELAEFEMARPKRDEGWWNRWLERVRACSECEKWRTHPIQTSCHDHSHERLRRYDKEADEERAFRARGFHIAERLLRDLGMSR